MPSKMFSFNRGIFKQNLRQVGWVAIAYFICLLFTMPIQLLFEYTSATANHPFIPRESLFFYSYGFLNVLTFTLPLLLGIFLFRYMQVKLASDFIHSLPIRRENLFIQQMITGTALIIVPFLLIGAILWLIGLFIPAPELLSLSSISEWVGVVVLMNLFVFYVTVFVGMFTGMSVLQGALTYILFVFPAGIIILFLENISFALYGFTLSVHLYEDWIPFTLLLRYLYEPAKASLLVVYAVIGVLAFISAYFLYKRRHTEAATLALSFSPLKPLFKYGVTFCFMLLGGLYYGSVGSDWGWIIFGYIISALFGYFIAEMIIQKSWRVFQNWKGFIGYLTIISLIGLSIYFDITGFEKRIPAYEEIDQVFFSEHGYLYTMNDEYDDERQRHFYEEPDVIQAIISLQEQLIKDKHHLMNYRNTFDQYSRQITIVYELKNGRSVIREYTFPTQAYEKWLEPILKSNEYMLKQNPILDVDSSDILSIQLENRHLQNFSQQIPLIISEENDIQTFYDALVRDIDEQNAQDILNPNVWETYITVTLLNNEEPVYLSWNKSFSHINEWLKERQLLSQTRLTAETVNFALIVEEDHVFEILDAVQFKRDLNQVEMNYHEISSEEEIEALLYDIDYYGYHSPYTILLFMEDELIPEIFYINDYDAQKYLR